MGENNIELFVVSSENPEETRKFVKVYHDFLDSELLNRNEKMLFIMLKRYLDFRNDKDGIDGAVFPDLETLAKQCGMTITTVRNTLKKLKEKNLISIKQRGLNKSNEYVLRDYASIWKAGTDEELQEEIKNQRLKLAESIAAEYGYSIVKEKEPDISAPTKVADKPSTQKILYNCITDNYNTPQNAESQEQYTIESLRELYDYDVMVADNKFMREDIDTVLEYILDIIISKKPTIRISGEDKPIEVVRSRLLKLTYSEIIYSINKYKSVTERINNPKAYMITLLYESKNQMNLDIANQVSHDMYHWNDDKD